MRTTSLLHFVATPILLACAACGQDESVQLVRSIDEFDAAIAAVEPGDKIVLANGTWMDVELKLSGDGLADRPIELTAEEPGKVIITGQSNLGNFGLAHPRLRSGVQGRIHTDQRGDLLSNVKRTFSEPFQSDRYRYR